MGNISFSSIRMKMVLMLVVIMHLKTIRTFAQGDHTSFKSQPDARIDNKYFQLRYPDTLSIGAFTLVVEEYDKGGTWDIATNKYKRFNGIGRIKFSCRPDGIRVRFTELTVKVANKNARKGLVLEGVVHYPTDPAVPANTFTLNVSSGFQLEVSELSIYPNGTTKTAAKLILPSTLAQNNNCRGATLNLGIIQLSQKCEFYKELPDSSYGVFSIGNTTMKISGRGYVVDFSSTSSYNRIFKPVTWNGVVLMQGSSKGSPSDEVISNIGYLQAEYSFINGTVESSGLTAYFSSDQHYRYGTIQPLGYSIEFNVGRVSIIASQVSSGYLQNGKVTLPRTAVRQANDAAIVLNLRNLIIQPNMDVSGVAIIDPEMNLYWGDLVSAGGSDRKSFGIGNYSGEVLLFFSASPRKLFIPVSADGKNFVTPFTTLTNAIVSSLGIQGATFSNFSILVMNTRDISTTWKPNDPSVPLTNNPVKFWLDGRQLRRLNVVTEGVHCNISGNIKDFSNLQLGDPSRSLYVGSSPFDIKTVMNAVTRLLHSSITIQCVESSVISCDFRSFVNLPKPTNSVLSFKEMVFTSTADNAGGKLEIGNSDSLKYWGLALEKKPGFSSAGLISVRTGQIVLTAAGLSEKRHFAEPFWITWGEILANGAVGRLFFDYNAAGQKFDGFNFVHEAVALSTFSTNTSDTAFLRVGGTIHFPFFAGNYLHILDLYDHASSSTAANPYNFRRIHLSSDAIAPGFLSTDYSIAGNWMDGLATFNFTIAYADASQDGFIGNGFSGIRYLTGGSLGSTLEMHSRGTCIRIGSNLMDQRSVSLGPVANISNITRIWGCVCIKDDDIENLVVGGEVSNAANQNISARAGSYLSAILQLTPSLVKFTLDGEAYLSLAATFDASVNGHMQLILNKEEGFLEGEVKAKFRLVTSDFVSADAIQGEGQLNWHFGDDFQELQGMAEVSIMSISLTSGGGGEGVGAGIYIGHNAPLERAWVLQGNDPRYSLDVRSLPDKLTGVYGSASYKRGVSFSVLAAGGYNIYVGLGAFIDVNSGLPLVVGHLGGRIYGDILGGTVSVSGYINLELIGPYPFSFRGTVEVEACFLFFCKSYDITVGLNSESGFYVE